MVGKEGGMEGKCFRRDILLTCLAAKGLSSLAFSKNCVLTMEERVFKGLC